MAEEEAVATEEVVAGSEGKIDVANIKQAIGKYVKIDVANIKQAIGKYVVFWRNEVKEVGKIIEVDEADRRIVYELASGPDKGKRYKSRYAATKPLNVFNEDTLVLALLEI